MNAILRTIRTVLYKFGFSGISLLYGILVARYLTVSDRGIYQDVTTTLLLGTYFFAGYANFFNYGLNRLKINRQTVVSVLAWLFVLISAVDLALLAVYLIFLPKSGLFLAGAFILGTMPLVLFFGYCSRLLQALNEIDWLNRLNALQVFSFLVFSGILWTLHYKKVLPSGELLIFTLWGWLFSNLIVAVIVGMLTKRLAGIRFIPARDRPTEQKMFDYGHKISVQNLLAQLNYRGDFYSVQLFMGLAAASIYGIAVAASEILWQVSSSIALVVYSKTAGLEREHSITLTERSFRITFWLTALGAAAMYLVFSVLIGGPLHIYGAKYESSVPPFQVLILGTMAFSAVGILTQFFTDQLGKVKYPMFMQAASMITNIGLSALLIPHLGIVGGALASSSAYALALVMSIAYYHYHTKRPIRALFLFTGEDMQLARKLLPQRRSLNESSE